MSLVNLARSEEESPRVIVSCHSNNLDIKYTLIINYNAIWFISLRIYQQTNDRTIATKLARYIQNYFFFKEILKFWIKRWYFHRWTVMSTVWMLIFLTVIKTLTKQTCKSHVLAYYSHVVLSGLFANTRFSHVSHKFNMWTSAIYMWITCDSHHFHTWITCGFFARKCLK